MSEFLKENSNNAENQWDVLKQETSYDPLNAEEERKAEGAANILRTVSENFDEYMEIDAEDKTFSIEAKSTEITNFECISEHKNKNGEREPSKKAHFICCGFFGPSNELFGDLIKEMGGEDVYAIDRTGDFNMEHALNGVIENVRQNNYEEAEIIAISVAAGKMGQALENRKNNKSVKNISLTYVDPFDIDYLALGGSKKDSFLSKTAQGFVKSVGQAALVAIHPFRDKILKKGGMIGEKTSVKFLAQQFAALSDARVFDENGDVFAKDFLNGVLHAGSKDMGAKNRDEQIDTGAMVEKFRENGVNEYLKAGTHGVIERREAEDIDSPEEAYRRLREDTK